MPPKSHVEWQPQYQAKCELGNWPSVTPMAHLGRDERGSLTRLGGFRKAPAPGLGLFLASSWLPDLHRMEHSPKKTGSDRRSACARPHLLAPRPVIS